MLLKHRSDRLPLLCLQNYHKTLSISVDLLPLWLHLQSPLCRSPVSGHTRFLAASQICQDRSLLRCFVLAVPATQDAVP